MEPTSGQIGIGIVFAEQKVFAIYSQIPKILLLCGFSYLILTPFAPFADIKDILIPS